MTELSTIPISRLNNAELDTKIKTEIDKNGTDLSTIATNCITKIPQDIKLELNNGTLTLKAGSKVYVPNGAGKFDIITISADRTATGSDMGLTTGSALVFSRFDTQDIWAEVLTESGTGTPTNPWTTYYNTNENKVYRYQTNITTPVYQSSFPIAKISFSNGTVTSIDQVFNGFGYIGSTVFALPDVKGLIPNGRNADGSLKNVEVINNSVLINTFTQSRDNWKMYLENTTPISLRLSSGITYLEDVNHNHYDATNAYIDVCCLGSIENVGSLNISNFTPKTTFHALDYNDRPTITYWE